MKQRAVVLIGTDLLPQLRGGEHSRGLTEYLLHQLRLASHRLVVGGSIGAGEAAEILEVALDLLGLDKSATEREGVLGAAFEVERNCLAVASN